MVKSFKSKYLSKKKSPYFIAEIGINHNGFLPLCLKMIKKSKEAGAHAVKFQKRDAKDLLNFGEEIKTPNGYLSKNEKDIPKNKPGFGAWAYPDIRLEFGHEEYKRIKIFCKKIDIDLIVTPWDEKSVDFLEKLNIKVLKIASIDANNFHFCEYVAKKKIPTIISTGTCTYAELEITKKIFNKHKCPFMFMHCTSSYPSQEKDKNLKCIPVLSKKFNVDIGFSGHGLGMAGSVGAIALGSEVIEKHVTLSKKMSGPDHEASLDFETYKSLVDLGNKVYVSLGNSDKGLKKSEKILHNILARRIVARHDLKKNDRLNFSNLKPVITKNKKAILVNKVYSLIGKKLKKNVEQGDPINIYILKK
jgi:N,N'-diacetyllegionaminate synthase